MIVIIKKFCKMRFQNLMHLNAKNISHGKRKEKYFKYLFKPKKRTKQKEISIVIIFHPFTETDYKPTANAGSDIVINLPQNYVTLYGNASTDDKGIKSYEWTKAPDGQLAADMMVNW